MKRNAWAPIGAVAATIAVVAVASLLSTDRRPASPPVLRIAGVGSEDLAVAAAPGSGAYRLVGDLPGGPAQAAVRNLSAAAAPVGRVRALAAALGETAAPQRLENGWAAGNLRVSDDPGNPWTWGQVCAPEAAVSSDRKVAESCSLDAVQSVPPAPPGDLPGVDLPAPLPAPEVLVSKREALAATAAVREALDVANGRVRVEGPHLVVDPVVDDLPTSGMSSLLRLSADGTLVSASGWLSMGVKGETYPLRTAQQALDELPGFALGAPCDSAAGCPAGPAVTGGRLGLTLVTLEQGAGLVPAWLFDVEGSPVPLVALAVADRFLGEPDTGVIDPGSKPGAPEPGRTEPGGGGADPSKPGEPDPGPPTAPEDREMFSFDGAYADSDAMVLVVRYGDSGSCPSEDVQHSAVEEPGRVIVVLSRMPMAAALACTLDYQAKLVRVALTSALAGREVIDGSRKEPVPVSTGSPPFG